MKNILFQVTVAAQNGHCIWYGECHQDVAGHTKNCPYEGPAKELDSEGQELFKKHCSYMLPSDNSVPKTCCDTHQLKLFDENIKQAAALLQRCPSCMLNFVKQICEFTCSPEQSTFINVSKTGINDKSEYFSLVLVRIVLVLNFLFK